MSPETQDRRVRRTRQSLHHALLELAREKAYDEIAVQEILSRADVGRSTFYAHFRSKNDLLEHGIDEMMCANPPRTAHSHAAIEQLLAFSLPLLEHIDRHRHTDGPPMGRRSRHAIHARLQTRLLKQLADEMGRMCTEFRNRVPAEFVAHHISSTFVLVLNWWVEREPAMTPRDVDTRFRALLVPALIGLQS
jgi:AcrR family transcriptional regulator